MTSEVLASASLSKVGKRLIKGGYLRRTLLTCVCWSMTSETTIRYGSRSSRHGRSRPNLRYQRRMEVVIFDLRFSIVDVRFLRGEGDFAFGGDSRLTIFRADASPPDDLELARRVGAFRGDLQFSLPTSKLQTLNSRLQTYSRASAATKALFPSRMSKVLNSGTVTHRISSNALLRASPVNWDTKQYATSNIPPSS